MFEPRFSERAYYRVLTMYIPPLAMLSSHALKNYGNCFNSDQLTQIYGNGKKIRWLIDGITQDRTPLLRQYLLKELAIDEISPERILPKLDLVFFEGTN